MGKLALINIEEMDSWECPSRSGKIKSMNDTELKTLSAQVKKLAARVEALERLLQRIITEAGLRETIREGVEELGGVPRELSEVSNAYCDVYRRHLCGRCVHEPSARHSSPSICADSQCKGSVGCRRRSWLATTLLALWVSRSLCVLSARLWLLSTSRLRLLRAGLSDVSVLSALSLLSALLRSLLTDETFIWRDAPIFAWVAGDDTFRPTR
jgi:hypothetical protein